MSETTEIESLRSQLQSSIMAQGILTKEKNELFDTIGEDKNRLLAEGFYRLAKVFYDKADLKNAEEFFLKSLELSTYPKDAFAIFKAYGFLIRIYSEALNEKDADRYILKAEEIIDRYSLDAGSLSAEHFYNVGMVNTYKGEFEAALDNFKLAYQKAQTENEPELISKALYAISTASYHLNRHNEALSHLSQLKQLLEILKKGYLKGSMHILYGNIYKDLGKFEEATENFNKAINLLQQKNCWNLYGYILLGKGIVLKKKGEYNQAMTFFNLALNTICQKEYRRLTELLHSQVEDVNDSSIDLYLDRHNRIIHEKSIGTIDFKHRFVLLEILFLLAKNPGGHFNKEDLARSIWKDEYNPLIHDKLIYTSISRLRKLIEPKGGSRKYIIRGKDGYMFNPRVNARFHKENDSSYSKLIGNVELSSPV